ncbi:hypothetical protein ACQUW5_13115 [Legionella sp. CNM-1927-20]|uniref:hypothetical protein n=1 Tax=Legionella sp. CNM-1927-20 TaxID=3422221 RepID=UPI00403AE862
MINAPLFLLKSLDPNAPDFGISYDRIIIGTIIIALAFESDKYADSLSLSRYYPLTYWALAKKCELEILPSLLMSGEKGLKKDHRLHHFIKHTGKMALEEKSIPLNSKHLDLYFSHNNSLKEILNKRLAKYNLDGFNPEMEQPQNSFKPCNLL